MRFTKRNGHLHLRRRVPRRYAEIEPREYVWISLHTDLEDVAKRKAPAIWDEMLEAWEAKLHGDTADAKARFEAAKDLAAIRGFRYLPASKVAKLPRAELFDRLSRVERSDGTLDMPEARALLGGVAPPEMTVSVALEDYWKLERDSLMKKSEDQTRRWRNPRIKAVKNLIAVIGDKPIAEITSTDMQDFRQWWIDRMVNEGLSANSANKDLIHVCAILKVVNKKRHLGLSLPLSDLSIKDHSSGTRPTFSRGWIESKLIKPGALAGLNPDARGILLGMINTGYRPSEGAGLTRDQIRLDADVPHISIEPVGRMLKSKAAQRKIPLLGVSLEAFREFPDGFPRYQRNSASLSATVNKFLRAHGLAETEAHTMYSLRHAFEDRMLEAGIDDRVRRDLFGHSLNRERYGEGGQNLRLARELLIPVAI
ncbi:tyrosine-type recombinase/integrase [Rhodobacter sp. NTK016B]|uniref:tyrosine-type recombinase/integrase n=1 Tax=Rhodobacter sp. NTK016B TaxID=2759676 RepID=UPI001A903869|nr:tyrosine-type recombinase/integrase [Rhodobacter sp. NTK016B]MBN8294589.1 tyrosine-type recombinase/integrase [Rhodobacter sp. NTK016B]